MQSHTERRAASETCGEVSNDDDDDEDDDDERCEC